MHKLFLSLLLFLLLTSIGYLIYSQFKKKKEVRESYAFKCLAAIVTLVGIAIASISSRQGLADQAFGLVAEIFGHPVPPAAPAPFSEKALIVILVGFAIQAIYNSHKNWSGPKSTDEVDRARLKHSNSLFYQACEEGNRLIFKKPKRRLFVEGKRFDPVAVPEEPNLVWHDHARELFELWMPLIGFRGKNLTGWDSHAKCWIGENRRDLNKVYLFCLIERPSLQELNAMREFVGDLSILQKSAFVIFKSENGHASGAVDEMHQSGIRLLSEEYLYGTIVDFSDYFNDICNRVEKEFFPGTTVSVADIYVPSAVTSSISSSMMISDDLGSYLSAWSARPAGRQIAILGEYGQGKSTASLMFAYDAVKSNLASSGGRVPIVLELRGKSPANLSTVELLAAWGQQYQLQASALMRLLIDGRIILILEGFDEMSNVSSAEARIAHFRSLWRFSYPKSKVIFTGRRNLFFEDNELHVVFKSTENGSINGFCESLYLRPFDWPKIEQSLRWTNAATLVGIKEAGQKNPQIFDIVSRPSLLFIVASLWSELGPLLAQGKLTSAQVIDRFILHSYERQQEKEIDLNFMALTTTERRFFHEGLAAYMGSHDATNQITNTDLRAAVERLYISYPDGINISPHVILETSRPPLKDRIPDYEEAVATICTDVRTHGILVNDVGQRDAFRFAHKSFYEVLVAKAHANSLFKIEPLFYNAINAAMGGSLSYPYRSPEVTKFFSEILMMHVRPMPDPNSIPIALYDLIAGHSKRGKIYRDLVRAFQFFYLRIRLNETLCNRLFILIQSAVLVTTAWRTETVSSFIANYPAIARFRWIAPSVQGSWSFFGILIFCGVLLLIVSSSIFTLMLTRRVELWAAVLIASDKSMHETLGKRALYNCFGKTSAKFLLRTVRSKYAL